jgi:hypothetical protein
MPDPFRHHQHVIAQARAQMDEIERALGIPSFW